MEYSGNIVDVVNRRIFQGTIIVNEGKIVSIEETADAPSVFILPGLIDAHIHIESSMLIPSAFARIAVIHGTTATVSDPHEIANVLGLPGIRFMMNNGKKVPFKFFFGASSCVPATIFETSGAILGLAETEELLSDPDIHYLSEMMNFPGVLFNDQEVIGKLEIAGKYNKPVDGHAPGLRGVDAKKYADAGITTDHECSSLEEALEKISYGMKILIREGSAAKNFDALSELFRLHPDMIMLCSDDKHPSDLVKGHINELIKKALDKDYDFFDVIRSCTINPVNHYHLDSGLLQPGDDADFIIIDDLQKFNILSTYIRGEKVAENGKSNIPFIQEEEPNNFNALTVTADELIVKAVAKKIKVIVAVDGELITGSSIEDAFLCGDEIVSDTNKDILKIVVKNRYFDSPVSIGFVRGFGLKSGAIASSVAHDSHNIIAVGTDDKFLADAINLIISSKGGISAVTENEKINLALPVAGIMTSEDGYIAAGKFEKIDLMTKTMGSKMGSPFMTLSFMALLVIPELKISDKGLFDGKKFCFTEIF